jgi:arylsulfatase A-like enzyme
MPSPSAPSARAAEPLAPRAPARADASADAVASTATRTVAPDVVTIALFFALAGAVAQLLVVAAEKRVLGRMSEVNPHAVWMSPVALLLAFVPPALLLALAERRWPLAATRRAATWGYAFLAALNLCLISTRLQKVATLILAAGIATQLTRWIAARPGGFARLAHRSLGWMAGVVLLAGGVVGAAPLIAERRALAALPAAERGAPNVLLIILDTVRAASTSLNGYSRPTTPRLDSLARHGVVFDRAMTTAPWTLPTHGSIFTGRWAHELSTAWDAPLDDSHPTLAAALARRGYRTGGFAANPFYTTREFGMGRGFSRFEDYSWTVGEVAHAAPLVQTLLNRPELRRLVGFHDLLGRKSAPMVVRDVLEWVDREDDDARRPFFAFLNLYDAHDPYLPRAPFDTLFGPAEVRRNDLMRNRGREGGRMQKTRLSPEEVEGIRAAYEGAIAQLDHDVAALLDSLRARRLLDNTLVIVTSDHGEMFGEHGLFEHGKVPYLPQIHAPLLLVWPGRVPAGARVEQAVSVREIPATVMTLVGGEHDFPGAPLSRFWVGGGGELPEEPVLSDLAKESAEERRAATARGRALSLVQGRYHYLRFGERRERLYDIEADAAEARDLAPLPEHAATLARMRAATDSLRRSGASARGSGRGSGEGVGG